MPIIEPVTPSNRSLRDLPNGEKNAVEIPTGAASWHRFAFSYKATADRLADTLERDAWRHGFALGAPMMFLYRHYVETHLKSLLVDAGELLDDPQDVPLEHYLVRLWGRVRALLLRVSPQSDGPWFQRADAVIRELDSIDPTSFAFRYPVRKDGSDSLATALMVDASNVRQIMEELHILLDGASSQIAEYMQYKNQPY
ncbi:hypothetical protein [Roseisolibacter sp. H3M3-2]|uniref:hypothetical protein n=1 Tax=Roseisolibacter sp. H3M3-2 TaxID=3031323 RepID=UPI0023DAF7FE|nr:hypothetical protein [Roseisolibacter sp. H3M3-2]MDF1502687.1 hypothetical protein [Roseisolibacter sp. H3M3-2]